MQRNKAPTLALALFAGVGLGSCRAEDAIQRADSAEILRVVSTGTFSEIAQCLGGPEPSLRVRVYNVRDPRELATVLVQHTCMLSTVFIAVSSCDDPPRHALYRAGKGCSLRGPQETQVEVEPGPAVRLNLRWISELPDPASGRAARHDFLSVRVSPDSAQVVPTERYTLP